MWQKKEPPEAKLKTTQSVGDDILPCSWVRFTVRMGLNEVLVGWLCQIIIVFDIAHLRKSDGVGPKSTYVADF